VWKSTIDDRVLHFRLIGVNNQNFIMKDEETGTWWQQVTGVAIQGPLKGRRLERMPFEQVTFGVWIHENPRSSVLESRPEFSELYHSHVLERGEDRDGEFMAFPAEADPDDPLEPGELLIAVQLPGVEKAYSKRTLREQNPISDRVAGMDILLVLAADDDSVRCFDRSLGGRTLQLFRKPAAEGLLLVDAETGSEWDFSGTATAGPLAGQVLKRLPVYSDYWFDWKRFHPDSPVYTAGKF
jgi:hypothetical protein